MVIPFLIGQTIEPIGPRSMLWIIFIVQTTILSVGYYLRERSIPSMIFLGWIAYTVIINLADNMLASYENFTVLLLMIAFSFTTRKWLELKKGQVDVPLNSLAT